MAFTEQANKIFLQAIRDYHLKDHVDTEINNPYERNTIEHSLYLKCWIDTVQWHLEDIIRDPHIDRDRQLFPHDLQRGDSPTRCPSEHREPGLGY